MISASALPSSKQGKPSQVSQRIQLLKTGLASFNLIPNGKEKGCKPLYFSAS